MKGYVNYLYSLQIHKGLMDFFVFYLFLGHREVSYYHFADFLQVKFLGLWARRDANILSQCVCFAIFWGLWKKRNVRIFSDPPLPPRLLWKRVSSSASLRASKMGTQLLILIGIGGVHQGLVLSTLLSLFNKILFLSN